MTASVNGSHPEGSEAVSQAFSDAGVLLLLVMKFHILKDDKGYHKQWQKTRPNSWAPDRAL